MSNREMGAGLTEMSITAVIFAVVSLAVVVFLRSATDAFRSRGGRAHSIELANSIETVINSRDRALAVLEKTNAAGCLRNGCPPLQNPTDLRVQLPFANGSFPAPQMFSNEGATCQTQSPRDCNWRVTMRYRPFCQTSCAVGGAATHVQVSYQVESLRPDRVWIVVFASGPGQGIIQVQDGDATPCGQNEIMVGMDIEGNIMCEPKNFSICPDGTYLRGMHQDGTPICREPRYRWDFVDICLLGGDCQRRYGSLPACTWYPDWTVNDYPCGCQDLDGDGRLDVQPCFAANSLCVRNLDSGLRSRRNAASPRWNQLYVSQQRSQTATAPQWKYDVVRLDQAGVVNTYGTQVFIEESGDDSFSWDLRKVFQCRPNVW
jgi:hypothetical protein